MKKFLSMMLLISLLTTLLPTMAFAQSSNDVTVQRYEFPMTLSDNQSYTMVGYLYTRQGNPNNVS